MEQYILNISTEKFLLSRSAVSRYGTTTNNYAEHVNKTLRSAREMPILQLFCEIYLTITTARFERAGMKYADDQKSANKWAQKLRDNLEQSREHTAQRKNLPRKKLNDLGLNKRATQRILYCEIFYCIILKKYFTT